MTEFVDEKKKSVPIIYDSSAYGALANNVPDHGEEKFYLTTAISYTNGYPHIGHAYEFLSADALVRFNRVLGKECFFLTGTDEHGQKVAASAEKGGKSPLEHCDHYVEAFKKLHESLLVTYSDFLRTTCDKHIETSQKLWQKCADAGDIYLDAYEGWYNEREEVFVSNAEAEATQFKDPGNGAPLKRVVEESYFFRMSKYTERLIQYIESNPESIQPDQFRNNILGRLHKEGLKDLSISRTSFSWGIPVPAGFDPKHVMYVWFDALTNYVTGVNGLSSVENDPLAAFWPANVHIIGKDIVWFHSVIWPCMLMSANVPLPKQVFCHGFVNDSEGKKMSKSYNNVVDPSEILRYFSIDSIRYYTLSSITYGADLNFSTDSLKAMHNSELADILGNLVHRVLNLAIKYCNGKVPDTVHDPQFPLPFDLALLRDGIAQDIAQSALHSATAKAMEAARATNRFLTEAEPWKMKGPEGEVRRVAVVRTALEAVYAFMHFLAPVLPVAAQTVFDHLHTPARNAYNLNDTFYNLVPGTELTLGPILFTKLELESSTGTAETAGAAATGAAAPAAAKGKKASAPAPAVKEVEHTIDFTKLDFRVGTIVSIANHPTSERLYVEQIDVGNGTTIQVVSGLRAHYTLEQLAQRQVLVVCNLKESKFQGSLSQGMVLAVKHSVAEEGSETAVEQVELLAPPANSVNGDRVFIAGYESFAQNAQAVWNANQIKKGKVWETVVPKLHTNAEGVPCYDNQPLFVSTGPLLTSQFVNSKIQ